MHSRSCSVPLDLVPFEERYCKRQAAAELRKAREVSSKHNACQQTTDPIPACTTQTAALEIDLTIDDVAHKMQSRSSLKPRNLAGVQVAALREELHAAEKVVSDLRWMLQEAERTADNSVCTAVP